MPGRVNRSGSCARFSALALVFAGMACTDVDHPEQVLGPTASPESCDAPHIIFLNGGGGAYRYGAVTDSATNTTSIPWFEPKDRDVTLPPAEVTAAEWQEALACLRAKFEDFNVEFTLADPGDREHIEIVFSTDGLVPAIGCDTEPLHGSCAAYDCARSHREIAFTRGVAEPGTTMAWRVCLITPLLIGFIAGLDRVQDYGDGMSGSYVPDIAWLDEEVACGMPDGDTFPCRCTGEPTQNSYQTLMEFFGPKCEE